MSLLCRRLALPAVALLLATYPFVGQLDAALDAALGLPLQLDRQLLSMFIFSLLALGLYVQVGLAGLMQLGGAAFFALGAYTAGVLTVQKFPFQLGLWSALAVAPVVGACAGALLGALCARVRGDQLAMVTLGFGEVVRVLLLNMESITDGSRGLNPLPPLAVPQGLQAWAFSGPEGAERATFVPIYLTALACLLVCSAALGRLRRSPLGLALLAMRDNELAACAVGHAPAVLKAVAMALGGAISALAGALYAGYLTTTAEPNTYDANLSYMILCAVILGGLHHRLGVVVGAALLVAFDNVLTPLLGHLAAALLGESASASTWANFSNWRWLLFGLALILTMRWRPEGLVSAALALAKLGGGNVAPGQKTASGRGEVGV